MLRELVRLHPNRAKALQKMNAEEARADALYWFDKCERLQRQLHLYESVAETLRNFLNIDERTG